MAAPVFIAWNAATGALTGPPTAVATASTVTPKTMLQIVPQSTSKIRILEWGYSFTAAPANNVQMELVDTATAFATVTTLTSAGVVPYNDNAAVSNVQYGTALSGYSASGEGTVTSSRLLGYQYENGLYFKQQFPLGREPEVAAGHSLRIRATPSTAASVSLSCYVIFEE